MDNIIILKYFENKKNSFEKISGSQKLVEAIDELVRPTKNKTRVNEKQNT